MSESDSTPAPSSSGDTIKTGSAALNDAAGFKPMPPNNPTPRKEKEFKGARDAAYDLSNRRQVDTWGAQKEDHVDEVEYRTPKGERAPANEAVDLQRAADDLIARRKAQSEKAELDGAISFEQDVNLNRAANDFIANPEAAQEAVQWEQPQNEQPVTPGVPGVPPEVSKALQNPVIREAIQAEVNKAQETQAEYSRAVTNAYNASLHFFGETYPEFRTATAETIVPMMQQLAQTNPQRYNQALASLQKAAQVEKAMIADQKKQIETHERWAADQDQLFERHMGNRTPAQRAAIGQETIRAAAEMGVSKPQLIDALRQNPILRSAVMQRFFVELAEARIAKREGAKALRAVPVLPPVVRPGVRGATASPAQVSLDALNKKLSGAKTQESQLRAAAEILANRRKR